MNREQFNEAYAAIQEFKPFAVTDEGGDIFRGGPTLDGTFEDLVWHPGIAIDFLETEKKHNTLQYVFYVNGTPIAFYGAFGLLRIPQSEYTNVPEKWDRYNQFIDDLTAPNVDSD